MDPVECLAEAGHNSAYVLWSALDGYFGSDSSSDYQIACTEATLPQLAGMPGALEFPGSEWADAIWYPADRGRGVMLRCVDALDVAPPSTVIQGRLLRMPGKAWYRDPFGCYPLLRNSQLSVDFEDEGSWLDAAEIAIYLSRYDYRLPEKGFGPKRFTGLKLLPGEQRMLLMLMLGGEHPDRGLRFLFDCGFIEEHWPLFLSMARTHQSKDFHPEGNVWDHTLATLVHRKKADPELGLALLLHDCGKPSSHRSEGNQFHRHAQIGAAVAVRFLRSLEFDEEVIRRIRYLVANHMVPSFLSASPPPAIAEVLDHELFPLLLELFRCDISSSFRGPEPYYQACKLYRNWKRKRRV
ncbi:HD domain-containing protein [Sediminispirochaeta smaragdinae]|uniref:Metal dependent phosphohydrolase n=1 Tax=Sediminispirochaeta smaragdinae (strain DSM 11293 / JCM 15392 / SEBR 4228) TaxID=573413 RepID=E1R8F0_SEDSS|nr:HD domain-containing protein [Sediminispirochaeta smaragdinae]ADK79294.1 metal dependent phosphohydrolase [Sediminispirochaeta smaragdinae DSM 11293]